MRKMLTVTALVLAPALAAPGAAWAADCAGAYHKKDWAAALKDCPAAFEKGDVKAAYRLGQIYRKGKGTAKDAAKAAQWYRKAAEKGHRQSQLKLGDLYARGKGVPKDAVQAHMWVTVAIHGREDKSKAVRDWLGKLEAGMKPEEVAKAKAMAAAAIAKMKK